MDEYRPKGTFPVSRAAQSGIDAHRRSPGAFLVRSSASEPIEPKKHLFPLFLDDRSGHALRARMAMSRQLE